jgi:[ribosomal protein S5]-alanine N-acetyltransferase
MIETKRLMIIPFTHTLAKAATEGSEALDAVLPYKVAQEWPNNDYAEIIPFIAERLAEDQSESKWCRLIIHKADHMLIGDMGCKGGPDENGIVEIGYGIVPEYRSNGYATEMVQGFVQWLIELPEVKKITAECLVENPASSRVLEKSGFKQIRLEDGMIYWEI